MIQFKNVAKLIEPPSNPYCCTSQNNQNGKGTLLIWIYLTNETSAPHVLPDLEYTIFHYLCTSVG